MNIAKKSFRLLGLLIISLCFSINTEAKNFSYQGMNFIFDRPEGELKYFEANLKAKKSKYGGEIKTESRSFLVPVVFASDGKAYARNLLGYFDYYEWPLWIEGEWDSESIVFKNKTIIGIEFYEALFYTTFDFFKRLEVARILKDQGIFFFETIDSIDDIVFNKSENDSYIIDFQDDLGFYYETGFDGDYLIERVELKPSQIQPVIPPNEIKSEEFQINFTDFGNTILDTDRRTSLRLKAVRTEHEIYLQGLSVITGGDPDAWIKGEILGNKVIFKNGLQFGVNRKGEPMFLTSMNVTDEYLGSAYNSAPTRMGGWRIEYYFNPNYEDLVFDYDRNTGKLTNPSTDFGFTKLPNQAWNEHKNNETHLLALSTHDFFGKAEIIKIPEEIEFKPVKPNFDMHDSYISCKISYLDENGYMMEPENMYIQVLDNGLPIEFEFRNFDDLTVKKDIFYPFENFYIENLTEVQGVGFTLYNCKPLALTIDHKLDSPEVRLIYKKKDGSSNVDYITSPNLAPSAQDNLIYDLYGRIVNDRNLPKGIYIKNGKKFLIK